MRILITGSNGMLGSDLVEVLSDNYEVIPTTSKTLDITNKELVLEKISEHKPDVIINSAAYTDVDGCESNKELAYNINGKACENLAICSANIGSTLIHISTDYVFDGKNSVPYTENDNTNPINVYGKSKLIGEEFIKNTIDSYFIFRTSWLYGVNGDNFVKTMIELSKNNSEISVVNDQRGSPTFTHDLAIVISKIVQSDKYGIYNLTNSDNCTWFDFAKDIFELSSIDMKVNPVKTDEFPRPAKRPKYSVLSGEKLVKNGFKPLRPYKKGLKDYLSF
ncbi:dTDP-4-dehydrorhamnose reductase [Methanobrevibacter filiformis]|uniref:dTDP-4-dehydrorhamnose reductase n=1 Tax=Methanobrevibacter filiformis TaxID=55758 RepID=A0A166FD87_9EURY|nr:dTDP-4-dehydrorhamnose reductase [Methanobrevibacter filiformis]KZX17558.1 dTDP-4-dehydrorhamnose reductase [Methanobrevibacter filiformis]